jgi:hypothetical protein
LLLYSSKPSLGVYQLADHLLQANKFSGTIITASSTSFSGAVAGEEVEDFCEGSFRMHIFYFVIVLLYFIYFTCIVLYKKPKKIRILGSCFYLFTLVYYV